SAVVLSKIRGRLHRQRPPRSHPRGARRARLDRELSERLWLAARPALGRRHRQFSGLAAMEFVAGLHQDGGLFLAAAGRGTMTLRLVALTGEVPTIGRERRAGADPRAAEGARLAPNASKTPQSYCPFQRQRRACRA